MITLRSIDPSEAAWFGSLAGDDITQQLTDAWTEGASRPGWALVALADGEPVARGALFAEPVGGGVETLEGVAAFLWANFDHPDHIDATRLLLDELAERLAPFGPTTLNRRLNSERHAAVEAWCSLLEGAGFELLQEKEGFAWHETASRPQPSDRLTFRSLREVGRSAYRDAVASTATGTLDRNDQYYISLCGPGPWAEELIGFLSPEDEASAFVGYTRDGRVAGFVMVASFDAETWTIVHIGVVPEQRGHGYVDDLLARADAAARERGFRSGLSDVDVRNAPMIAAMERAGHRRGERPWHVWHYRRVATR